MSMTKCPMCGYNDAPANTFKSNVMNHYVNTQTGEKVLMNSSEQKHIVNKIEYVREDLHPSKGSVTDAPKQTVAEVKNQIHPEPTIVSGNKPPTIQTNTPQTNVAPQQTPVPPAKPGIVSPETVKPGTPQTNTAPK